MAELSEDETAVLVAMGICAAIDIGTLYLFMTERKAIIGFKRLEKEYRQLLRVSPDAFDVTAKELKRIVALSKDAHATEGCELRFAEGLARSFFARSTSKRQQRGYTGPVADSPFLSEDINHPCS